MKVQTEAAYKAYVICTSPRSGSTLLCKLLAATGQAGNPKSYFHEPDIDAWQTYLGLETRRFATEGDRLEALFSTALEKGSAGTGIFGLRLQRRSFDYFFQQLAKLRPGERTRVTQIEAVFGKPLFIHLTRSDKIAQAVSFVKASQTGLWHKAPDGRELERLAPPKAPQYDADRIKEHVDLFTGNDRAWNEWFEAEKIAPLRISYDTLSNDPVSVTALILKHLGLDTAAAADIDLPVARLSDRINSEWIERFQNEKAG